jgi:hypothetical protein
LALLGFFPFFLPAQDIPAIIGDRAHLETSGSISALPIQSTDEPGKLPSLTVVLPDYAESILDSNPWDNKKWQIAGTPDPWQPERVLTAKQIESMPNTGHLWSLLNQTDASVVADIFDIAGMHSDQQFLLGVHGSSWTQNQAQLNGLNVTSPSGDGMLLFPDLTSVQEITYAIGDSPTWHTGPGAHISMTLKTGERKLHGQTYLFFQGGALQNVNPTQRYQFFGITDSDERWKHLVHGGFQLSGPAGRFPWTYFGSVSTQNMEKWIRNHGIPVSSSVSQETIHLSGRMSPKDRLSIFWSGQQLHQPEMGASPQVTRAAALNQKQTYQSVQSAWTRDISPSSLLELQIGAALGRVDSQFQPHTRGQSREEMFAGYLLDSLPSTVWYYTMVDMLDNTMTGPAPLAISSNARAMQGSAAYSTIRQGSWNSSHRFSAGASYHRASVVQNYSAIDGVNLFFFEGTPNSVSLLNTPARTHDRISQWELYADENFSLSRLSINLGVSVDSSRGANLLNSGLSANALRWTNVAGRFGMAYRVMDKHPLVLRAGLAQIYDQPLTSTWNASNPDGLRSCFYRWTDSNRDGLFQKGENTQILKVTGSPSTKMDPNLKNPKTAEITLGFTQELLHGVDFHLSTYRRFQHQLMSLVNEGVPFSSYTPMQVVDPGPQALPGSGEERPITVFNQRTETLGQDRYLLTNPAGLTGFSEGLELKLAFSFARVQAEAAMTRYRAVAATAPGISARENDTSALLGVFDDPNKAIFARGSTYFDRGTLGRLWLTSEIGWEMRWSMIASYQDGLPYSRYLPVKGLNQGIIGVLTSMRGPGEAGSSDGSKTAHYETLDMRLTKDLFWGPGKLAAILDAFNLTNCAQPLVQMDVTAPTQYYRIPLRFETPRSLQLGLRYSW